MTPEASSSARAVQITTPEVTLEGDLTVPGNAAGIVLFAHGSGSSRRSPRNRYVASALNEVGLATLLFDLLTEEEERIDMITAELRFDIPLLASRLVAATDWLVANESAGGLPLGYFGASTGAAAALIAATERPQLVRAVVSRGGRPDIAAPYLPRVKTPTLLIVGGNDYEVIRLNEQALDQLETEKELRIIPGATHLFEEPGTLEQVAAEAGDWFNRFLGGEKRAAA